MSVTQPNENNTTTEETPNTSVNQQFPTGHMQPPMVHMVPNPNYNTQQRGFPGYSQYIPPNPYYGVIINRQPHRNCVQLSMETVSMAQDVLLHMNDINIALQTVQGVMATVVNTRGNIPPNMVCGLLTDSSVRELRDILSSFVLRVSGQ